MSRPSKVLVFPAFPRTSESNIRNAERSLHSVGLSTATVELPSDLRGYKNWSVYASPKTQRAATDYAKAAFKATEGVEGLLIVNPDDEPIFKDQNPTPNWENAVGATAMKLLQHWADSDNGRKRPMALLYEPRLTTRFNTVPDEIGDRIGEIGQLRGRLGLIAVSGNVTPLRDKIAALQENA